VIKLTPRLTPRLQKKQSQDEQRMVVITLPDGRAVMAPYRPGARYAYDQENRTSLSLSLSLSRGIYISASS
jgi:cbb3-type cytochrome oxidase subunit 3